MKLPAWAGERYYKKVEDPWWEKMVPGNGPLVKTHLSMRPTIRTEDIMLMIWHGVNPKNILEKGYHRCPFTFHKTPVENVDKEILMEYLEKLGGDWELMMS